MMPSWSSEICSSTSDTSMPRLSTPRMVPTPSVMFLPGMKAPGGTNTPFMPARAFGAPHTTCTGSPSPVSTMQTRSRSAFGCCSAEITRAIMNGASALRLVLDALDLEPDHGELVDDLVERRVGVEMLLQPGEGEFHELNPPASVGKSSGRKP